MGDMHQNQDPNANQGHMPEKTEASIDCLWWVFIIYLAFAAGVALAKAALHLFNYLTRTIS